MLSPHLILMIESLELSKIHLSKGHYPHPLALNEGLSTRYFIEEERCVNIGKWKGKKIERLLILVNR